VSVAVAVAGAVVAVAADRFVRGQLFQPLVIVLVQAALIVVARRTRWIGACTLHSLPECKFVLAALRGDLGSAWLDSIGNASSGKLSPIYFSTVTNEMNHDGLFVVENLVYDTVVTHSQPV